MNAYDRLFIDSFNSDPNPYNPYYINGVISAGGQARVYDAVDVPNQIPVALKVFDKIQPDVPVSAFIAEYAQLRALRHANIIGFRGAATHKVGDYQTPYLIMEKADTSLANILEPRPLDIRPLPSDKAASYLRGIMKGIRAAHEQNIVHRDIKPANILLKDGNIKVTDFGIAIRKGQDTVSITHDAVGTLPYMPVEQFWGHPGKYSDVYSIGVAGYQMATGIYPRQPEITAVGEPAVQWLHAHENLEATDFTQAMGRRMDAVAEDMEEPLMTAIQKEAKDRYPDAASFLDAFNESLSKGQERRNKARVHIPIDDNPKPKPAPQPQKPDDAPVWPRERADKTALKPGQKPPKPVEPRPKPPTPPPKPTKPVEEPKRPTPTPAKKPVPKPTPKPAAPEKPRRGFLKIMGLGGVLAVGGVIAYDRFDPFRNIVDEAFGPKPDEQKQQRLDFAKSIFNKLSGDDPRLEIARIVGRQYPQEAIDMASKLSLTYAGEVWSSLALQVPDKTIAAVKELASKSSYHGAVNASMGLASYLYSESKGDQYDETVQALSDLQEVLSSKKVDRAREAHLIKMATSQKELPRDYFKTYSSKGLEARLLEYATDTSDKEYGYEYLQLVRAIHPRHMQTLVKVASLLIEPEAKASPRFETTATRAWDAVANFAPHLPAEAIGFAHPNQRKNEGDTSRIIANVMTATPHYPELAKEIASSDPKFASIAMGLATYDKAFVENIAEASTDAGFKTWLLASANPDNLGLREQALATLVDTTDQTKDGKANAWFAVHAVRGAMANTAYNNLKYGPK